MFSILLPSRNGLAYVKFAVESVLAQSITSWELIISDNCSDEDYRGYLALIGHSGNRVIRPAALLARADNWNHALAQAAGEYVIAIEDGDVLAPEGLTILKAIIEEHDRPDAIFSAAYQYVYPGALPRRPRGYLATVMPSASLRKAWGSSELPSGRRRFYAEQGMRFRRAFGFNIQYLTWRKSFIDSLAHLGPFFQTPCPHYYASLVTMRTAPRVIANPKPCIIIGTSPKSCDPLDNPELAQSAYVDTMRTVLPQAEQALQLPGDVRYRNWLVANLAIYQKLPELFPKRVSLWRYRTIQTLWMAHRYYAAAGPDREAKLGTLPKPEQRLFIRLAKRFQLGKRAGRSLRRLYATLFDESALGLVRARVHRFGTHTDVLDALAWLSVRHDIPLRLLQAIPRRALALRRRMRGVPRQLSAP
ncbi:MAG: glycosyltransferase [Alphaproteobacteria bacterium]|nr:glycosyltransferase [Alphaproteobacteria bacterium]MCW5744205.1 glycosyltransferase [Alphaproteobacteria bacterium]